MDTKQLKALVQRASANEGLEKAFGCSGANSNGKGTGAAIGR